VIVDYSVLQALQETPDYVEARQLLKAWVGMYKGQDVFVIVPEKKRGRKKSKKRA